MPVNKDFYPIAGSSGAQSTGYTINQSIRFNKDDTAYMTRTPSGAGNTKKWTISWWEKRGRNVNLTNGNEYTFHTSTSGINNASYIYNYNNHPYYWEAGNTYIATIKLRDPSAWYNNVVVYDSANPVPRERIKLFINGTRILDFSTYGGLSLNQNSYWNSATAHYISNTSSGSCVDAYLAEIVFIDGQALDPSSFSETNDSGIWIPKDPSDLTFGSNGFYLKGADSSALGTDSSGNGNNFTTGGLASHDQVADTPNNNFAVINPLVRSNNTYSEGNLKVVCTTSTPAKFVSTIGVTSGKWYMEFRHSGDSNFTVGITTDNTERNYIGISDGSTSISFWPGGSGTSLIVNASTISWDGSGTTWSAGDFIGLALNADDSIITMYKNGSSLGSYDYSSLNWVEHFFAGGNYVSSTYLANFGQEGTFAGATTAGGNSDGSGVGNFKYSVPAGYKALCTKNLFTG